MRLTLAGFIRSAQKSLLVQDCGKRHPFLIDNSVGKQICWHLNVAIELVADLFTSGGLFRSPARQVTYLPAAAGDRQGAIKRHGPLTPDFRQFLRGCALPSLLQPAVRAVRDAFPTQRLLSPHPCGSSWRASFVRRRKAC
ncbi:hypothetical protein BTJ39_00810 [Izhakiella australiensis]|uniref:Uncharacterized protein n=1 Tax=Izhakiella australiensis TaxID=1926881 RepID=A0A1S8YSE3_9GAMM|nr:hypothetical protein [Izhakiella australiensis]OON41742.1 hypothetical protein BTJ39_00810 [Izhakiella australiensis]